MRIRRFGHAGIGVQDLAVAETFYGELLGFAVAGRYPEDAEVMLEVGETDHLLLKSGGGALHHIAFEADEGARGVEDAQRRLLARGVPFERVDHDGDPALSFRDPDGHLLEVYAATGSTPRFASAAERRAGARRFIYTVARPVDRAVFEHRHSGALAGRVLNALAAYRNPDGGFGHALEPDVRCPDSQPIHVQTALELLREAGIRAPAVADECCAFLEAFGRGDVALPAMVRGALDYPAAAHWQGPFATEPSLGWTTGLAAELVWHGAAHPFAARVVDAVAARLMDTEAEAHRLLYAIRFAGVALTGRKRSLASRALIDKLADAEFYLPETPVERYGLTPLHFAPHPQSPAAGLFERDLIEAHLDDLLAAQAGDGGWPVRFQPPGDAARLEWRGRWTVEALDVLKAWGRL